MYFYCERLLVAKNRDRGNDTWTWRTSTADTTSLPNITEIEFGHQTATLPNLCSSDSAVRCRHMDSVGKWYPQAAVFSRGMPASDIGRQMAGSREERRHSWHNIGLPNITGIGDKQRHALFGLVVRLDTSVPAHQACSGTNWWRPPGRPRKTWIQQIGDGTTTSWKQTWQSAEEHGHRGESSQQTPAVYALWW